MNARDRDVQRWFRPWKRDGYTLGWAESGHRAIRDRTGALVTTMSSTPKNLKAALDATERILRRHVPKATCPICGQVWVWRTECGGQWWEANNCNPRWWPTTASDPDCLRAAVYARPPTVEETLARLDLAAVAVLPASSQAWGLEKQGVPTVFARHYAETMRERGVL